ncbi:MAG TPA: hypothetical protein PKB06_00740 [Actinotalea sp.]|nr:hypothetical protein [Actinotalea sp.]
MIGGREPRAERVGEQAMVAGVVAFAAGLIPVVGEFVSIPLALVALCLGVAGLLRHHEGRAVRVAPAVIGSVLGALTLLGALLIATVTHIGP